MGELLACLTPLVVIVESVIKYAITEHFEKNEIEQSPCCYKRKIMFD